jgi:hypothetical protein
MLLKHGAGCAVVAIVLAARLDLTAHGGHAVERAAFGYPGRECYGWASGPTAWLSQHVLGVQTLEPGFQRVRVAPRLGRLEWAEGSYPTPLGPIKVRHEKQADGTVQSNVQAPEDVGVERE